VKFWRYKNDKTGMDSLGVKDGRWRWMLYDTDWGFGYTGNDAFHLNLLEKARKIGSVGVIFDGLLKNKTFQEDFRRRFEYHLNTTFEKGRVLKTIDQFQKSLDPEIAEHIDRWRAIGSYENWKSYVQELREFAIKRPDVQMQQLNKFLNNSNK
jgi:hypothetical protein